jgi:hypothetical protein
MGKKTQGRRKARNRGRETEKTTKNRSRAIPYYLRKPPKATINLMSDNEKKECFLCAWREPEEDLPSAIRKPPFGGLKATNALTSDKIEDCFLSAWREPERDPPSAKD